MEIFITADRQYSVLLDFLSACNITATHSRSRLSNLSASVGGEIQSLAWDPTGERLAVLLKGLSHFSSTRRGEAVSELHWCYF